MTLGVAAAAGVRLIVWCKECQHQVEPDPAEMATRYGAETPVFDWRERLASSRCGGGRQVVWWWPERSILFASTETGKRIGLKTCG
jgi:hypothetical protein